MSDETHYTKFIKTNYSSWLDYGITVDVMGTMIELSGETSAGDTNAGWSELLYLDAATELRDILTEFIDAAKGESE